MPRPGYTKGSPVWTGEKFPLTKEQKLYLCEELLGLDMAEDKAAADQVILNIQFFIGSYMAMINAREPTQAEYLTELNDYAERAQTFINDMCSASGWMKNLMAKHDCNLYEIAGNLSKLSSASFKAEKEILSRKKKKPKIEVRKMLVNTLYQHFQHYNKDYSEAKFEFIETCLKMANIPLPKDIRRLIYKTSTPQEDAKYIHQIM